MQDKRTNTTDDQIEHWCQATRAFEWGDPQDRTEAATAILDGAARCGACAWFLNQRGNRTRVNDAIKNQSGQALHEYLTFRAARERQAYALTPEFFTTALDAGVRVFFGIETDDAGELLADNQNPTVFAAYQRKGDAQRRHAR
jgi:hypothetical protein